MGNFRLWFEEEEDREKVIRKAYDLTLEKLLGGDREDLSLSLSRIKAGGGRDEEGQREAPSEGWKATLKRLGDVFDIISPLGDVKGLDVNGTIEWLTKHGSPQSNGKPAASADFTVFGLLERLFGKERFSKLRGGKELPDTAKAKVPTQLPTEQPSSTAGQPAATSPPAAQEMMPAPAPAAVPVPAMQPPM